MALKLANNATSRLAGAITNAQTTLSVTPGTGALFPALAGGDWHPLTVLKADGTFEIMRVTARSTDTLTVTRGQEGTAAIAFSADDRVELRLTKAVLDYMYSPDNDGAGKGDRNRVINGSCQIVNVASVASVAGSSVYGGPELFRVTESSDSGGQFTQSQGSLTWEGITLPTVRQTVNAAVTNITAGNYWNGIQTLLEGFNVFDLRGKPVTLSFVFNTNLSGTYSVAVRDGSASQSYVSTITAVANTPVQVAIPLASIPSAANIPNSNALGLSVAVGYLNTGNQQTATLNQWQSGNFASASGATNWGATADNFIELTNLQLEEGTVATPFIRRSYQQELALTKRYFQKGSYISALGGVYTQGFCSFGVAILSPNMRAAPTTTATTSGLTSGGTFGTIGAHAAGASTSSFRLLFENTGGAQNAIAVATVDWTASARL